MLWYRERKAATTETKLLDHVDSTPLFEHFIEPDNAEIGSPVSYSAGDIIITQKQKFNREISRGHKQRALDSCQFDSGFGKQRHCLIIQATF